MNHPRPRASNPRPDRSYAAGDGNAAPGFVGDVRSRDTPDPIPNSEVKSRPPMILQRGKVGHCRLQRPDSGKPGSGLLRLREDSSADYADSADGKSLGWVLSPLPLGEGEGEGLGELLFGICLIEMPNAYLPSAFGSHYRTPGQTFNSTLAPTDLIS